ncbi:replicative DNA helicase [Clostridium felsineum]|uniref:replicative DNA helicase n=1 Tax=Clostridium felsineum TaxID=36839 RepID=UPI00098C6A47|nr:replicative DNA helicase [Clostridium felsineum]URZ15784.1 Replicative DNA helicase [Clostridium felsineum DSM 794]
MIERPLPHNIEAEMNVLGAILKDNDVLTDINFLKESDFYSTANKMLFKTILDMESKDIPIDTTTLINGLGEAKIKSIGGITYIFKLVDSVPSIANVKSYADIVKNISDKRKILYACYNTISKIEESNPLELISEMENQFLSIGSKNKNDIFNDTELMNKAISNIQENYNNGGQVPGTRTGYKKLDYAIGGLNKGDLIVIAGRPSMGKTMFALNLMEGISKTAKVALFEFEMSEEKLGIRRLAMSSCINAKRLSIGKIEDKEWGILTQKAGQMASRDNVFTDTSTDLTINEIKSKSKKLKLKHGLDVIIIDHLQLIEAVNPKEPRIQQVTEMTRQAKKMAKELGCAVILLSQLSRAPEQRNDHRPQLSDLRESGAIEQDADVVMFMYRDEYYNKDSNEKGILECIIAKQRDGATGTIKFAVKPEYQLVADIFNS